MKEDMDSLRKNKTWELVDHPAGQKLVSYKWLFKIKEGIEGVQKPRYKARLVARGFTQRADCMLIACKSKAEIGSTKSLLKKEFDMKELGEAKKILGMEINRQWEIDIDAIGWALQAVVEGLPGFVDSDYAKDPDKAVIESLVDSTTSRRHRVLVRILLPSPHIPLITIKAKVRGEETIYYSHNNEYLEICRCYKSIYEIPSVKEDPAKWTPVNNLAIWLLNVFKNVFLSQSLLKQVITMDVIQWTALWSTFKDEFENEKNMLIGCLIDVDFRMHLSELIQEMLVSRWSEDKALIANRRTNGTNPRAGSDSIHKEDKPKTEARHFYGNKFDLEM
ncbi:retrovirus-related pol polyprotein from transposon TNT 1-94 [Tanacetum coccineum]|uniref:Retrovirus-related pol polyprotein from transposon TNT 1-94 n=1 Tax=Tanacetum coccineum TaxID=301880 RepID=A0ABQ4WMD7_9ASTR